MNTIRRGLKRKEPGQDPEAEEYQAGLNQFQVNIAWNAMSPALCSYSTLKINLNQLSLITFSYRRLSVNERV